MLELGAIVETHGCEFSNKQLPTYTYMVTAVMSRTALWDSKLTHVVERKFIFEVTFDFLLFTLFPGHYDQRRFDRGGARGCRYL
jgi:hypothetical protein